MACERTSLPVIIVEFLRDCARLAAEENLDAIYFLTREGLLFVEAFEALRANTTLRGIAVPKAKLLHASRVSTFLPSLPDVRWGSVSTLLEMNPSIEVRGFLGSLGLSANILYPDLHEFGLHPGSSLRDDDARERFRLFYELQLYGDLGEQHRQQRRFLLDYLEQTGIRPGGKFLIVDIGWRGGAQDNLARLLPTSTFKGHYLGLLPLSANQLPNIEKTGFLFDANRSDADRRYAKLIQVMAVEFPFTSNIGSIIRYKKKPGAKRAKVLPVHDKASDVEVRTHADLAEFRARLQVECHRVSPARPSRAFLRRKLIDCVWSPDIKFAESYGRFENEQNFLHGASFQSQIKLSPKDLLQVITRRGRQKLRKLFYSSGWPQAQVALDHPILYRTVLRSLMKIPLRSDDKI